MGPSGFRAWILDRVTGWPQNLGQGGLFASEINDDLGVPVLAVRGAGIGYGVYE